MLWILLFSVLISPIVWIITCNQCLKEGKFFKYFTFNAIIFIAIYLFLFHLKLYEKHFSDGDPYGLGTFIYSLLAIIVQVFLSYIIANKKYYTTFLKKHL